MPRLLSQDVKDKIISLRQEGHSIPEIHKITGKSKSTVQRLMKDVEVFTEFKEILRIKQGGSKMRASILRDAVAKEVEARINAISERDSLFLLIGLYWGEGTKGDFALVNSDPFLIVTFIKCLESLGIHKDRLTMTVRVHSDIPVNTAIEYWFKITELPQEALAAVEVIEGREKGKLRYGMCRIRVKNGIRERLIIQSAIQLIGNHFQTM